MKRIECKYKGCFNRAGKEGACLSCWYAAQSRAAKRRNFEEYRRLRAQADAAFKALREEFGEDAPSISDPQDLS